jgi:hypothetical protein
VTPAARRRVHSLLIGAYLVVQLLLPLRYYLGLAPERDERFAWRMFSSVRLQQCTLQLFELVGASSVVNREVPVEQVVGTEWAEILSRGWKNAVDRLLERRCAASPRTMVAGLSRTCRDPGSDQPPTLSTTSRDCRRGGP